MSAGESETTYANDAVARYAQQSQQENYEPNRGPLGMVQGGINEAAAVLDPTRRASENTERDIQAFGPMFGAPGWAASLISTATEPAGADAGLDDDAWAAQYNEAREDVTESAGDTAADVGDSAADLTGEVTEQFIPDWLPVAGGGVLLVAVLALLAYAFGQLFDIGVGGGA